MHFVLTVRFAVGRPQAEASFNFPEVCLCLCVLNNTKLQEGKVRYTARQRTQKQFRFPSGTIYNLNPFYQRNSPSFQ